MDIYNNSKRQTALKLLTFINVFFAVIFFFIVNGLLWSKNVYFSYIYPVIPLYVLFNFIILLFLLLKRKKLTFIYIAIIALFYSQINSLYSLDLRQGKDKSDVQILNYNLSGFNVIKGRFSNNLTAQQLIEKEEMIHWIQDHSADIKCFQEFYHSEFPNEFNTIDKILNTEYPHYCYAFNKFGFGVITFSKYPIINSGEVFKSDNGYNRGIFTDVLIHNDTLRIINVHLQSTAAKAFHPLQSSTPGGMISNLKIILDKIKKAHVRRMEQVDEVLKYIVDSPHDVILCGDLNSTPYSYTYRAIRKQLKSSFETAGKGFGFTLNSRTLFFLRIDHQFYSRNLTAVKQTTEKNITYSDHFPLTGFYNLPE